jgi:2-deoxy-D-gluconate 3-dehydrogenase
MTDLSTRAAQLPTSSSPFELTGTAALVTGARRGLGRAIALELARAGADVAIGLRDETDDAGLVSEIEALGRRALPVRLDVTQLDSAREAIDRAVREFGRMHTLVNNAGGGIMGAAIDVTEDDFDRVWAVVHMTRCHAVEWGQYGIRVNALAPTFIETDGTEAALSDAEFRADTVERIAALHRIGVPREVSGAAVFLASPAASLITGQTLAVDGGWTAR